MMFVNDATEGKLTLEHIMKAIQDLSTEHKTSTREFNKSYEAMNEKLIENTNALKEQTEKVKQYFEKIEDLVSENKVLKDKIQQLEDRLDETEQYSRRNCVEIQGLPVQNNDVIQTVKDLGSALGMEIQDSMIDACHTLGRKPNSKEPSGIIVKFVRRVNADDMLAKRRAKRDFSTRHLNLTSDYPIYVNESLTSARRRLLAMAREERKKHGYKWLWVRGGKILLRKEDNGPVIFVKCQADLQKIR